MQQFAKKTLITSFLMLSLFTVIFGVLYPLVIRGIGFAFFPEEAGGSLIKNTQGQIIGSKLLGQNFSQDKYFHPRPSYAGIKGYDPSDSSGSFLGPTSQDFFSAVEKRSVEYRTLNGLSPLEALPADAVMSSASGLDPHISIGNALLQAPRIAKARNISEETVRILIEQHKCSFWFSEIPYLNVLEVNIFLDNLPLTEKKK
ncbi:MAG: K(+)-transporting ATPase subunit C [Chlamydiae bacterium]|nr:K(+)-transporting ATPase subunit C [Chlamydiota bacterium]